MDFAGWLPLDNIYDIFSRFSVKSLARLRCVSKQWKKNIEDPNLAIIHSKLATEEPMPVMFDYTSPPPYTRRILALCNVQYKNDSTADHHVLEVNRRDPVVQIEFDYDQDPPVAMFRGSCNGLLYLSMKEPVSAVNSLIVINPLTKECFELPPVDMDPRLLSSRLVTRYSCGLGFDSSTNTFKMVCVLLTEQEECTMVHVLGSDSWREVPQVPSYTLYSEAVFANGHLHWLGIRTDGTRNIVCFDVGKEEFRSIEPPKERLTLTDVWIKRQLVDLHGEVGLGYYYPDNQIKELWILKHKEWVIHCCLDMKPIIRLPSFGTTAEVLGRWSKDGGILLRVDHQDTNYSFTA